MANNEMTRDEFGAAIADTAEAIYVCITNSGKLEGIDLGIVARAFAHLGSSLLNVYEQDEGGSKALAECRMHCAAMFMEQETRH